MDHSNALDLKVHFVKAARRQTTNINFTVLGSIRRLREVTNERKKKDTNFSVNPLTESILAHFSTEKILKEVQTWTLGLQLATVQIPRG